ncbi:MAG TPA: CopD family protein [Stellaceae bacterium]|nr:CopD family protein [Stellaceae bacterium]
MIASLLFVHILAAVIWVGGMFFAHQMVRPSVAPLDAPVRLALWRRIFERFFRWVWAAALLLLVTGTGMETTGIRGLHVTIMEILGIVMVLAFAHLYFAPWKRFRRAVDSGDFPAAAVQLNRIRRIVELNLALGLIVVVVGATGRYWS